VKRLLFRFSRFSVLNFQFIVFAGLWLFCAGCGGVDRTLTIRSDPPGAAVAVNGADAGIAPVRLHFTTYGVYEVVLAAPRCYRLRSKVPVEPPWYETMPIDFFAENLWPFTLRDDHEVTLSLKPAQEGLTPGLGEREQQLRERVLRGEGK